MLSEQVGLGGFVQFFGFFGFAHFLQCFEFGHFSFTTADESIFLQLEIAEVFIVRKADLELEHGGIRLTVLGISFGVFAKTKTEESHFESGDAVEAPEVRDGLDESGFFGADWLEFLL